MNTIRFSNKADFIAALEERRPFWRAYDARMAREHKAAEKKWLDDTRAVLRAALKWDYRTLADAVTWNGRLATDNLAGAPKCPALEEYKIDKVLKSLKWTAAKVFNVDQKGAWSEAHYLLTGDPDAPKSVC